MIRAADLVAVARSWDGVPFVHQGRNRHGVDCIGLVLCVRDQLLPWPEGFAEAQHYRRQAVDGRLVSGIARHCTALSAPEPGALIVIKFPKQRIAQHVALCLGETLLHAYAPAGCVREVGYREPWRRLTVSLWRLPGVEP